MQRERGENLWPRVEIGDVHHFIIFSICRDAGGERSAWSTEQGARRKDEIDILIYALNLCQGNEGNEGRSQSNKCLENWIKLERD
jgi:hypothetical protein